MCSSDLLYYLTSYHFQEYLDYAIKGGDLTREVCDFLFSLSPAQIPATQAEYRYLQLCRRYGWRIPDNLKRAVRQYGSIFKLNGNTKERNRVSLVLDNYQEFVHTLCGLKEWHEKVALDFGSVLGDELSAATYNSPVMRDTLLNYLQSILLGPEIGRAHV